MLWLPFDFCLASRLDEVPLDKLILVIKMDIALVVLHWIWLSLPTGGGAWEHSYENMMGSADLVVCTMTTCTKRSLKG